MIFDKKNQLLRHKPPKIWKCKICGKDTECRQKKTCSVECAIEYAKQSNLKKIKSDKIKAKKLINQKDLSYQLKKTQAIVNKWIRQRDGNICITCGNTDRQMHAGHYMPIGRHSEVRFDEHNIHSQCSICNNFKSGNLAIYRQKLIEKYGLEEVERLEYSTTKKWDIEELVQIQKKYK